MARRSRFIAVAAMATSVIAVGIAPVGGGALAASKCRKGKEAKGCKLPNRASYFKRNGENDEMQVFVYREGSYLNVRSNCLKDRSKRFTFKSRPKVGSTYKFSDELKETSELSDGVSVTYTYKVDLSITFTSAKQATTKGRATVTAPVVPPSGSFQGEDAFNSDCDLARKLKRVAD